MKFASLVLFLSVALVFGERQLEETNAGLLQYDSPEVKEMHTKCGTLVAEHKGLYHDFSTYTSTADTSTEPFLPTPRTNLRHREDADVKTMHRKFGNLDLPFSLPLTLAPNFEFDGFDHLQPPGFSGLSLPVADGADAFNHGGHHFSTHTSTDPTSTMSTSTRHDHDHDHGNPAEANPSWGINPIDPDCDCNLPPRANATCCKIPPKICNPGKIDCNIPLYVPFPPVCGCDGKTYANFCDALFGNCVKCWKAGRCPN